MKRIVLKTILVGILFIFVKCTKMNSCNAVLDCSTPNSFIENYSVKKNSIFLIKGVVIDEPDSECNVKIIEDLKGNFANKSYIYVWNGGDGNLAYLYKNDILIMLLSKYIHSDDKKNYNYSPPLLCGTLILKLSNGYIMGNILSGDGYEQTMLWNEFQKLLKINKKTKL